MIKPLRFQHSSFAQDRPGGRNKMFRFAACRRMRERMEWLALAGAFDALPGCDGNRRRALWSLPTLHRHVGAVRPDVDAAPVPPPHPELGEGGLPSLPRNMPDFPEGQRFDRETKAIGFSTEGHPMRFHRDRLIATGVLPCGDLETGR